MVVNTKREKNYVRNMLLSNKKKRWRKVVTTGEKSVSKKILRYSSKHQEREKLRKEHTTDKSPTNHPEGVEYSTKEIIHADMGDTPVQHKQTKNIQWCEQ